jgi:hypothetical protein
MKYYTGSGICFQNQNLLALDIPDTKDENKGKSKIIEDGQFVIVPYRMLSAHMIWIFDLSLWENVYTEFTPEVLKEAVALFQDIPLQKDHFYSVDSNIGDVKNAYFDDKAKVPGVNGDYRINRDLDEKTAIRVREGHVKSSSVSIKFQYILSHPDMNIRDFLATQSKEVDGKVVRRIVTKIIDVQESSIVLQGADPLAKQLKNLKLMQAMQTKFNNINIPGLETEPGEEEKLDVKNIEEIKAELSRLTGKKILTDEAVLEAIKAFGGQLETLKTENAALSARVIELEPWEAFGKNETEELRKNVMSLARIARGTQNEEGKFELPEYDSIMINEASYDQLKKMKPELEAEKMRKFPARCQSCGEIVTEVRSSIEIPLQEPEIIQKKKQLKPVETIHDHEE